MFYDNDYSTLMHLLRTKYKYADKNELFADRTYLNSQLNTDMFIYQQLRKQAAKKEASYNPSEEPFEIKINSSIKVK